MNGSSHQMFAFRSGYQNGPSTSTDRGTRLVSHHNVQPSRAGLMSSPTSPAASSVYSQPGISMPVMQTYSRTASRFEDPVTRAALEEGVGRSPSATIAWDNLPLSTVRADQSREQSVERSKRDSEQWKRDSKQSLRSVFKFGGNSAQSTAPASTRKKKCPFSFHAGLRTKPAPAKNEQLENRRHTMTNLRDSLKQVGKQLIGRKRNRESADDDEHSIREEDEPAAKAAKNETPTHCAGCRCNAHTTTDVAVDPLNMSNLHAAMARPPSPAPSLRWARHDAEYYRRLVQIPYTNGDSMDMS